MVKHVVYLLFNTCTKNKQIRQVLSNRHKICAIHLAMLVRLAINMHSVSATIVSRIALSTMRDDNSTTLHIMTGQQGLVEGGYHCGSSTTKMDKNATTLNAGRRDHASISRYKMSKHKCLQKIMEPSWQTSHLCNYELTSFSFIPEHYQCSVSYRNDAMQFTTTF